MYYRSKFITNSSTTAFVCFGVRYNGSEHNTIFARLKELFQEHKAAYISEHDYLKESRFGQHRSDWANFIEWLYKREYLKLHPESLKSGKNYLGEAITYVSAPVYIHLSDPEFVDEDESWVIIYSSGFSCDWGPDEFDPYTKSKEQLTIDIEEFCDMFGFPNGDPKWWMEGYGVR
jgi:hypothetical protein